MLGQQQGAAVPLLNVNKQLTERILRLKKRALMSCSILVSNYYADKAILFIIVF
jgi:hypothetical protein